MAAPRCGDPVQGLSGKICIIAGGGTGIGQSTAIRLAQEGCKVVVGDIDRAEAEKTAAMANAGPGPAIAVAFDLADEASIAALVAAADAEFGGLDAIHVNANDNAAAREDFDAIEVSLRIFDRTVKVGLRGYLLCTRYALPLLLKRGGGSIIYTSSTTAFGSSDTRVSYGMIKAGQLALMRHVARRWGKEGIRANALCPGMVVTENTRIHVPHEFQQQMLAITPSHRLGTPEDVAAMVAMLVSDDGAWITGQAINVDGGIIMR